MSTLLLRAPILPRAKLGGFGRFIKTALGAIDVFAEAQQMADEAFRRFRYGRW
jgi:hypothetical protein